jgi:hypothetical protein
MGEGFQFLNIPRSYYGFLRAEDFEGYLSVEEYKELDARLQSAELMDEHGIVDIDISAASIGEAVRLNTELLTLIFRPRRLGRQ